ncbi:MAG: fructose-bisphosphatase class III, partial [Bacilli bacterium]|nr:fructose-bisphosphatase class III [Bacilli bacterium]
REVYNPYYSFIEKEEYVDKILVEFGLDPKTGHIVNGHVPVLVNKGENPVKANGKLFKIDGGLSKAYQSKTGIAGYTLIFNSHYLAIAEHKRFEKFSMNSSEIHIVETFPNRLYVKDTDIGKRLSKEKEDLIDLLNAYENDLIKERK